MQGAVQIAQFRLHLALQVPQHAVGDVDEIVGALAEIIVVQLAHLARVGTDHLLIGEVDIHQPALDLFLHRLDQRAVLQ